MKTGFARVLVLVWAVASATFPGAMGVAHALQATGDAAAAVSHVEAPGGQDCAPVHGADCGLCSTLRIVGPAPARSELPAAAAGRAGVPRGDDAGRAAAVEPGPDSRPRAPPRG